MTERERKDLLSVIHSARHAGRITSEFCRELCDVVERARTAALPAFPCAWPEPELVDVPPRTDIVWTLDESDPLVMTPDDARGVARRFVELADEADARDRARNTEAR